METVLQAAPQFYFFVSIFVAYIGHKRQSSISAKDKTGNREKEQEVLMETKNREWLKVPEVAEELNIPRSRAYELIARADLPAVRIGEKSIRVNRAELERFLLETRRVVAS